MCLYTKDMTPADLAGAAEAAGHHSKFDANSIGGGQPNRARLVQEQSQQIAEVYMYVYIYVIYVCAHRAQVPYT